jgi:Lipocalin-like domain
MRWPAKMLALTFTLALAPQTVRAMMEADKFIGAWRLLSAEFRAADDSIAPSPYGSEPLGVLIYEAQGTMCAQIASKDRKAFAVADRLGGSAEEVRAAFESYQAYCGTFKVDEREHTVTHSVTQALLPNWTGSQQLRFYKFQDGKLVLRTPPLLIGGKQVTGVLVWEKIKLRKE